MDSAAAPEEAGAELNWLQRWQLAVLLLLAAAIWCCLAVRRAQPGLPRLLLALPVLALQLLVPLMFDHATEPVSRMGTAFLAFRMASAKVGYDWAVVMCACLPRPAGEPPH